MFCSLVYLKFRHCKSYVHATAKQRKKNYVALLSAIYHVRKAVNNFLF